MSKCVCLESLHKRTLPRPSGPGCSDRLSLAINHTQESCEAGAVKQDQLVVDLIGTVSKAPPVR